MTSLGLLLISDYLSRRKQRLEIDPNRGVLQGSIFNVFHNFADDNTLYSVGKNI